MCGGWIGKHIVDPVVGTVKAIIKNPAALLVAVGVGIFNPALGLRMLATMAVSNIFGSFTKKPDSATDGNQPQQGNPVVLQPNTQNKLPFVYGRAVFSPAIIDAKISTNNQTMWYCLALCEAPDQGESSITINKVYLDGKTVVFDTNGTTVKELKLEAVNADGTNQVDNKVGGKIEIHFYRGNPSTAATPLVSGDVTALSLMSDGNIAPNARWTGNEWMADTIFMIVKLTYNQDAGITGLGNIVVDISNNQNGITDGYKPGSAMLDYLTNSRYGAGLSLDMVNATSFTDLDAYADEVITFVPETGDSATQSRYRFNGMIDTTQVVMNNLLSMADCCDSFIQYNESLGRWSVIVNKAYDQLPNAVAKSSLFVLDDNNIIGGVNVVPLDLNSTPNQVQSSYANWKIKGQITDVYAHTPQRLLNKLEPINQLTMRYPFVNDSVRAQYLSNRKLEQVRADYIVDLVADYSAITVDAGDVVLLTYQPYGARDYHITGISSDAVNKTITVTFDSPDSQPFFAGQRIGISDCKPVEFNGSYIVESATASTVTLSSDVTDALVTSGTIYSGLSWSNKPFRVLQVNENKADDGTLTVKLHMNEYSDQVYDNFTIQDFTPPGKNYLMDAGILGKPDAPTIPQADIKPSDTVPTFKVNCTTPATGVTMAMEFWYSTVEALTDGVNNYVLYDTQYNSGASLYGQSQTEVTTVSGLEEGTYYWRVRAVGTSRKSEFSDSTTIDWAPVAAANNLGDTDGKNDTSDMKIIPYVADSTNWSTNTRGFTPEDGVTVVAAAAPGSIRVTFSVTVSSSASKEKTLVEVWKDSLKPSFSNKIYAISVAVGGNSSRMVATGSDGILYYSDNGGITWSANYPTTFSSGTMSMLGVQSIWSSSDNAFKTYGFGQWDGSHNVGYTTGNPPSNQSMNYGQVLTYADQSGAQTNNLRNTINAAVYTGSGGMMYLTSGGGIYRGTLSTNMATLKATTAESSGTFKSLNDGVGNYVVGNTGTLLQKSSTWQTIPLYTSGTTLCLNNLFGVAVDSYGHVVVVGDKGTIFSNGTSSWVYIQPTDINGTVITSALRSVAWGNGYWIAVGDKGVILKSTDGSTWQQINNDYLSQNDLSSRNLNVVTYNASTHTFSIGGDGTLFLTSGDSDPSFSLCATPTRDTGSTSGTMTRMYYKGSNSDPKNNTAVPIAQQITSNTNPSTTISSTIIDTDYEKGEALSYYLVVGNMDGDNNYLHPVVYASSGVITATEYKK